MTYNSIPPGTVPAASASMVSGNFMGAGIGNLLLLLEVDDAGEKQ